MTASQVLQKVHEVRRKLTQAIDSSEVLRSHDIKDSFPFLVDHLSTRLSDFVEGMNRSIARVKNRIDRAKNGREAARVGVCFR